MKNVDFLELSGDIGDIRERLGAENEDDESFDEQINAMSSKEICMAWSGWNLGDGSWAKEIINMYLELEKTKHEL